MRGVIAVEQLDVVDPDPLARTVAHLQAIQQGVA